MSALVRTLSIRGVTCNKLGHLLDNNLCLNGIVFQTLKPCLSPSPWIFFQPLSDFQVRINLLRLFPVVLSTSTHHWRCEEQGHWSQKPQYEAQKCHTSPNVQSAGNREHYKYKIEQEKLI